MATPFFAPLALLKNGTVLYLHPRPRIFRPGGLIARLPSSPPCSLSRARRRRPPQRAAAGACARASARLARRDITPHAALAAASSSPVWLPSSPLSLHGEVEVEFVAVAAVEDQLVLRRVTPGRSQR